MTFFKAAPSPWSQLPQLAAVALVAMACGSTSSPSPTRPLLGPEGGMCAAGEFLDQDFSCPPPGAATVDAGLSSTQCSSEGDKLCHRRCTVDAECTDSARPYCRILGLFEGYDSNCNVGVRICEEHDKNPFDCSETPPVLE